MSEQPPSVPVTWPELLGAGIGERWLVELKSLPEDLAGDLADPFSDFGIRSMQFTSVVVLLGAESLRAVIDSVRPKVETAVWGVADDLGTGPPAVRLGLLSTLSALECGGLVDAPFAGAPAQAMLERLATEARDLNEPRRHTAGLAAVAVGATKLVPKFVGGGKLSAKLSPGETFLFNVPGFVRYMAVAVDKGATATDVEPAWLDFVRAFPHKLAAETLGWPDLLWAGRIYYHVFQKLPAAGVADAVRELVSSL